MSLQGGMRILSRFQEDICSRNIARGRRCVALQLPPDWSTAGLYYINVSGQSVVVEHRFTRKKVEVHDESALPVWTQPASLYIDENFSEISATLRSREDNAESGLILRPLFPDQLKCVLAIRGGADV